jgi:large subunit ribosomal protein L19
MCCVISGGPLLKARTSRKGGGKDMNIIREIENEQLKQEIPQFNVGDTLKVYVKVV